MLTASFRENLASVMLGVAPGRLQDAKNTTRGSYHKTLGAKSMQYPRKNCPSANPPRCSPLKGFCFCCLLAVLFYIAGCSCRTSKVPVPVDVLQETSGLEIVPNHAFVLCPTTADADRTPATLRGLRSLRRIQGGNGGVETQTEGGPGQRCVNDCARVSLTACLHAYLPRRTFLPFECCAHTRPVRGAEISNRPMLILTCVRAGIVGKWPLGVTSWRATRAVLCLII